MDTKNFKRTLLRVLIRGFITEKDIQYLRCLFSLSVTIPPARHATPDEERELKHKVETRQPLYEREEQERPRGWFYDKNIFKTALRNFDAVKDWFIERFAPEPIQVVIYEGIK